MMRKLQLFIFSLCLLSVCGLNNAYAKNVELPSKCKVFLPQYLLENKVPYEQELLKRVSYPEYGQNVKPIEKKYWVVYSDRSNNTTYTSPGDGIEYGKLDFNEQLRIADIQGSYALVYSEPNKSVIFPQISSDAVCKGWVHMDNLLLWDVCLASINGIYYKALLCINAEEKEDNSIFGLGYSNPEDPNSKINLVTDMNFYFIMKRHKNGMVLLSFQHSLGNGISDRVLYAWVPKESYVSWNQRSCLERTWEHEDVEYFADKNIRIDIFDTPDLNGETACYFTFARNNEQYSQYQYRMSPSALRFPILDGTTDNIYECSSFTSEHGSVNIMEDNKEEDLLLNKKKEALEKKSHLNLVIVIDGTKSMDPYFPAVQRAIKEGCMFFDQQKYNIKVGVLIYRDYADNDGLVEVLPLTRPNDPSLFRFLTTGGNYGIRSNLSDKTFSEALFYGIDTALDVFKFNPQESNLMLVVGDCGNDLDDPLFSKQSDIINKLVSKDVNLAGFQVRNLNSDAWNQFNNQLISLIGNSLQMKYDKLTEGNKLGASRVRAKVSGEGQIFYNDKINDELFLGIHKYAAQGVEISADVLSDLMKNTIKDYSILVQKQLDLITSVNQFDLGPKGNASNEFKGSSDTKAATTAMMNKMWLQKIFGEDFSETVTNQLISFKGWTRKKYSDGRNFFKPVLFISSEEFDELMTKLKPVDEIARNINSNDRRPYVDAIKALLKGLVQDSDMDNISITEAMNKIQGLNESTRAMAGENSRTLLEIADYNAVSQQEYRSMVAEFARKYKNLTHIKDGRYKYVREFNGAKYYWIPIEDLP